MRIRDVLKSKQQRELVTVPPGTTLNQATHLLAKERIGTVVVSSDGKQVAGILSERDIVRAIAAQGPGALSLTVDEVMTTKVISCAPDDTVDTALATMTQGRFRHMPVQEGDQMVGLVSLGDAVKARLDEVAFERNAMEGMIMGH